MEQQHQNQIPLDENLALNNVANEDGEVIGTRVYIPEEDIKFGKWNSTTGQFDSLVPYPNASTSIDQIDTVEVTLKKKIRISANRLESLLYDFLEELLFLTDTEGFILSEIKNMKIKKDKAFVLECTALGDHHTKYDVKGNIKSVTYSEMLIEKKPDGFVIEVVLDI